MRLILLLLLSCFIASCQALYTAIPKGTTSDESITQLKLDYRMIANDKVIGTVQNSSKSRIYDVRIRITITHPDHSTAIEHFVIPKINPYQNYKFKKATEDVTGVEMTLELQSSHY